MTTHALDLTRPAPIPLRVRVLKRAFDIVSASTALIALSPVFAGIAIAIRVDSEGAVIFRQKRLRPGPDGEPIDFWMYKFRSMRPAPKDAGPAWATDDGEQDRITRIGAILRKHRLDELPQFFNVLMGDMSLVGPRPEVRFFADQLDEKIPGYNDRHMVLRPGITGWAQVQAGYAGDETANREKLVHDLAYVAHLYRLRTYLRMEAKVIFRTFRVVLTGHGAK